MGVVISASQIDQYQTCPRKWGFRYLNGLKTEKAASAALGSELHEIAENYLKNGKAPDELTKAGDLFVRGLPYLPPPGSGGVEGEFRFEIAGISYFMIIDYRGRKVPGMPGRVVLDHKTSSNPKQYGLWERADWLKNPQAVLYLTYDLLRGDEIDGPDLNEARGRWLYYRTKGNPKAEPSDIIVTRAELEDCFEGTVHNSATAIVEHKSGDLRAEDLDPDTEGCSKYGGCPYHPKQGGPCKISTSQRVRGALTAIRKKEEPMDAKMLERIRARKAGANGAAAAPAAEEKKEDRINPPEAQQQEAAPEPERTLAAVAEIKTRTPRAAAKASTTASDEPSDEEIGRVVRFLAKLVRG